MLSQNCKHQNTENKNQTKARRPSSACWSKFSTLAHVRFSVLQGHCQRNLPKQRRGERWTPSPDLAWIPPLSEKPRPSPAFGGPSGLPPCCRGSLKPSQTCAWGARPLNPLLGASRVESPGERTEPYINIYEPLMIISAPIEHVVWP